MISTAVQTFRILELDVLMLTCFPFFKAWFSPCQNLPKNHVSSSSIFPLDSKTMKNEGFKPPMYGL